MSRFSQKFPHVVRVLLGLIFLLHGVVNLLHMMPQLPLPEGAAAFLQALVSTGWMMPFIMATEAVAGGLLVANVAVPFALVLLAPILVAILGFHLVFAPAGAPPAIVFVLMAGYLAWVYREAWKPLFTLKKTWRAS